MSGVCLQGVAVFNRAFSLKADYETAKRAVRTVESGLVGGTPRPKGLAVEVKALESGGFAHAVALSAVGRGSIASGVPDGPATLAGFALGDAPQLIAVGSALNSFVRHGASKGWLSRVMGQTSHRMGQRKVSVGGRLWSFVLTVLTYLSKKVDE